MQRKRFSLLAVAFLFIFASAPAYAGPNPPGPKGGPGASPDRRPRFDRDNNPPGPRGGAGTNWENPPGPRGGPGAGPDRNDRSPAFDGKVGNVPEPLREKAMVNEGWEKAADTNKDGIVDEVEMRQWRQRGPDNNPPGPRGGAGTNWENPPGPRGGPGASPDGRPRIDRDNNPPGPKGGRGTNWENPPGPKGGPGAGPNRPGGGRLKK